MILSSLELPKSLFNHIPFQLLNTVIEFDSFSENEKKLRLGKQFEACFYKLLTQENKYDIIAHSLQVFQKKQTLGELDFILKEKDLSSWIHLEIACKYYLLNPNSSNISLDNWVGPNLRDSLAKKTQKLSRKQFPLAFLPEAIHELNKFGVKKESLQQMYFINANLYVPERFDIDTLEPYFKKNIKGQWMQLPAFIKRKSIGATYCIPKKKEWLYSPNEENTWLSHADAVSEIKRQLKEKQSPLILEKHLEKLNSMFVVWWP